MDTLTHAVTGAVLAHAVAPRSDPLTRRQRLALGAAGGAFPDLDFALFAIDPLRFLAHWHQGPTHSLLLAPLWAAAVAAGFLAFAPRRTAVGAAWLAALAGLASHGITDALTAYGTALAYPWSERRVGLAIAFVIDPVFSAIVLTAAIAAVRGARRRTSGLALGLLAAYIVALAALQRQALEIGARAAAAQGLALERLAAYAQPLSPSNWKLVGRAGEHWLVAHVDLLGLAWPIPAALPWLGPLSRAYRTPEHLRWEARPRFGDSPAAVTLARARYADPCFADFRRFAMYPALARIDSGAGDTCVWFSDLRYDLPTWPETFRFGFCRTEPDGPWRLYRLRYFSADARQALHCATGERIP